MPDLRTVPASEIQKMIDQRKEIDRLRAELEETQKRYGVVVDTEMRLRAENERLKAQLGATAKLMEQVIEIKRQRDALLDAARPRRCDHADNVYCVTCLIEMRHRLDAAIAACEESDDA